MSSPTHMAGNITSWVARHVINNLDGENLNCDDAVVSDILHEFCPGCTDFNFADAPPYSSKDSLKSAHLAVRSEVHTPYEKPLCTFPALKLLVFKSEDLTPSRSNPEDIQMKGSDFVGIRIVFGTLCSSAELT